MAEESNRVENSLPRRRVNKGHWLRPATGTSAYRGETEGQQSTSLSLIVPAYDEHYLVEASLKRLKILETSYLRLSRYFENGIVWTICLRSTPGSAS
jgi:hypothetical protein